MPADRPFGFEVLRTTLQAQALQNADEIRYAPSGRAVSFTPTLVLGSDLVTPVIASGSVTEAVGRYVRINNLVNFWFSIAFGTGVTFNSGASYCLRLPTSTSNFMSSINYNLIGCWVADHDEPAGPDSFASGDINVLADTGFATLIEVDATTATQIDRTNPWTWAVNGDGDHIAGWGAYEASDGYTP